jgi:hypothetical protein
MPEAVFFVSVFSRKKKTSQAPSLLLKLGSAPCSNSTFMMADVINNTKNKQEIMYGGEKFEMRGTE